MCSDPKLCPTLWDPIDCSLPGSSVHGIFQARILEWVAISYSRESSQPRDRTHRSCIGRRTFFLTTWATWETPLNEWSCLTGVKLVHLCRHPRLLTSLFQTGGPKVAAPNSLNTKDPIISLPLSTWNKTNEHVIILERTKECYCTLAKRNPWCTTTISCGTLDMGKDWTSKPQGLGMWTDSKQNGELQLPPSSPCDIWGWIAKKWGIVD